MFRLFRKTLKVCTHDGDFHPDEVFACAALSLWAKREGYKLKIIRSRDDKDIKNADIVVDIGMQYDPDKNIFDHHQGKGAGARDNVPYASFGLVWKKYGPEICSSNEIAGRIENKLVMSIDALDNGVNTIKVVKPEIRDHRTHDAIDHFNLTYQEDPSLSYKQFKRVLNFAGEILVREITWEKALMDSKIETLKAIKEQNEPEILILDKELNWHEAVSKNDKIKFIVYPKKERTEWRVQPGKNNLEDFSSNRVKFPKGWWGLRGEELVQISGVKRAIFCHKGGWLAVTKTREGAIEMAEKALQNSRN